MRADPSPDVGPGEDGDVDCGTDEPRWFDNHCHIDEEPEPATVVAEAGRSGVVGMITVGTDALRSAACIELAGHTDGVWATAGLHPHDATQGLAPLRTLVAQTLERDGHPLVAIGECGLDYHYDHSPRAVQRQVFAAQVELAQAVGLPLVIHTRDAWDDTFAILGDHGVPERTVFHCFTGGPDEAERALAAGALLSVSGIVTFRSAGALREAVAGAPLGRLMVETDSPYLAPVPHRGRRNRPAFVARVGEEVAVLQGRPPSSVAAATTATAARFYGLALPGVSDGRDEVASG